MAEAGQERQVENGPSGPVDQLLHALTEEGVVRWENQEQRQSIELAVRAALQQALVGGQETHEDQMDSVCALLGAALRSSHALWTIDRSTKACAVNCIAQRFVCERSAYARGVDPLVLSTVMHAAREHLKTVLVGQHYAAQFNQALQAGTMPHISKYQMRSMIDFARACIDIQRRRESLEPMSFVEEEAILREHRAECRCNYVDFQVIDAIEVAYILPTGEDTMLGEDEDEEREIDLD